MISLNKILASISVSLISVFLSLSVEKPPPPTILSDPQDTLEIRWVSICEVQLDVGTCEVRYRTEEDKDWPWVC